ncbi:hypothetical protein I601_2428 [Nocardioides dokdonensis FR1436]|uniref:Gram-positive cocci surface proteins LPxTG domain-containing protein n=1 Tax=Nocardioides dokdonensis FR1436 TaxID=1300347 RepID=A0A1A9GL73_9ACTN|nr:hypothetical protein [Nocardioides dokdonensis]ANH38846.1 hypothetical protein I601_2428 [Nocardioides dokdonensis FR1436]
MPVLRTAAAALVVAGAGAVPLVVGASGAEAATCSGAGGISVVVDFNSLGGADRTGCVTDRGGSSAATVLSAAGVDLTRARNQPGFVCRVEAVPADDPCVNASPADAYWSLWWSDGSSGSWSYASLGVDQLKIPEGGSVAFAWDDQEGQVAPGTPPPTKPKPAPAPSPEPTTSAPAPTGATGPAPSAPAASTGAVEEEDETGTSGSTSSGSAGEKDGSRKGKAGKGQADKGRSEKSERAPSPTPTAGSTASSVDDDLTGSEPAAAPTDDAGLPTWVAPALLGVLGLALAGVAVVRRRRRP